MPVHIANARHTHSSMRKPVETGYRGGTQAMISVRASLPLCLLFRLLLLLCQRREFPQRREQISRREPFEERVG